jgi:hypothetical protein
LVVSKISPSTSAALTSPACAETINAIIIMDVHHFVIQQHFMTCCIVIMPSPYTSISCQWIFMGETCLPKTNQITLRTSWQDQVSHVAIAHQLIPCVASDWLLCHPLDVTPTTSVISYQKLKCLMNTQVTG